jgi:hypothetical protein
MIALLSKPGELLFSLHEEHFAVWRMWMEAVAY